MGPRMFRLLLLGIFTVLFMDEGDRVLTSKYIRFCRKCNVYNGYKCVGRMRTCWKFNVMSYQRACTTDNYYFNDRTTGRYLYRYSTLSCRPCEEGMTQVFHDLLRETFCCNQKNNCNHGNDNIDTTKLFGEGEEKPPEVQKEIT